MKHWQSYWSSGQQSSIPNDVKNIYGLTVSEFWREVFATQQADNEVAILELCCGNGALTKLLLSKSVLQKCRWLATDFSELDKAHFAVAASDPRLSIRGKVNAEQLPFSDNAFDYVVSQFGIEYAEDQAFSEAIRVLNQGAKFALIAHPAKSRLISEHKQALSAKPSALALIAILRNLALQPQNPDYKANFNSFMAETPDAVKHELAVAGMFEAANAFFAQALRIGLQQRQNFVESIANCFGDYYSRMEDMVHAALTEQRIESLKQKLATANANLCLEKEIEVEGELVAVGYIWQKS